MVADLDRMKRALRNAHQAGDTDAAKRLARAIKAEQAKPSGPSDMASGLMDAVTQGASFGFGDELTGIESAVLGRTPEGDWFNYDKPFSERYDRAVTAERRQQDQFRDENPIAATAAEIGGGLATGLGAGRAGLTMMRGSPSLGRTAAMGVGEGAIYGGVAGAGNADGEGRLEGARDGALMGGAVGGASSAALGRLARAVQNRGAVKAAPTVSTLRQSADAAYDAARARNPSFAGFNRFVANAQADLDNQGYLPRLAPKVRAALSEMDRVANAGRDPDFKTIEKLRKVTQGAAQSTDPGERRLGKMLRGQLDDFVERTAPVPEVKQGRELYRRYKNTEQVTDALMRGERRAATSGTGGNKVNAMRQNIRSILDSPRKRRGYSAEEVQAMERFIRGDRTENTLRLLGRLSPTSGALPLYGNIAATSIDPFSMIGTGVAYGAQQAAEGLTEAGAKNLTAQVARGSPLPNGPLMPPGSGRAAVARALATVAGDKGTN